MSVKRHLLIVILIIVSVFILYEISTFFGAFSIYGYVDADVQQIAAGVNGYVQEVYVKDNQKVEKGQLLLTIDPTPYELRVKNLQAELIQDQQKLVMQGGVLKNAQYALDAAAKKVALAQKNIGRYQQLLKRGFISASVYDNVALEYQTDQDNDKEAQISLGGSNKELTVLKAVIAANEAELKLAQFDLSEAKIYAPAEGYVTNLKIYRGDYVNQGTALFGLIDRHSWRIVADYHEGAIANIKIGQVVWVRLGSVPWHLYRAKVISISRGVARDDVTNNAALPYVAPVMGWLNYNYYFPVRIKLDDDTANANLFLGASVLTFVVF